jgi:hypothetical protein
MESHLRVEIVPHPSDSGYLARIGDTEFPIVDFAIQSEGGMFLSLVLTPDVMSIGDQSAAGAPPEIRPASPQIAAWGDGSIPDPREGIIPGWQPENLAEQVAGHAERVALRTWEPGRYQRPSSAFKRLIRLGGQGGSAAAIA